MIQLVLGYGHSAFTRLCIESIYNHTPEDEINLVVWENHSADQLGPDDINPENSVLLKMDQNYGCSTALNALLKDFGLGLEQDVMYLSNDHYVFPHWIDPLLENEEHFQVISPMHPHGLPDAHGRLAEFLDFKDALKREYLDHPESLERIREFLHLIYGRDLERVVREKIQPLPAVLCRGQFWAGCFFVSKEILGNVGLFRTDRGLACDEDAIWFEENIRRNYTSGVYGHCFTHHFQSITTNRFHLTMDHAPHEFSRGPVPSLTECARMMIAEGASKMKAVLKRGG